MAVLAYLPPSVTVRPSSHRGGPILVRRERLGSCNGLTESSPSRVMTTSAPMFTRAPDHGPCDRRTGSSGSTSAKELGRDGRRDGPRPWLSRTHDSDNLIRTLSRVCLVASNNSQEAQGWGGVRGRWFKRSYRQIESSFGESRPLRLGREVLAVWQMPEAYGWNHSRH